MKKINSCLKSGKRIFLNFTPQQNQFRFVNFENLNTLRNLFLMFLVLTP